MLHDDLLYLAMPKKMGEKILCSDVPDLDLPENQVDSLVIQVLPTTYREFHKALQEKTQTDQGRR